MQAAEYLRPVLRARSAGGRKIEMWMRSKQRGIKLACDLKNWFNSAMLCIAKMLRTGLSVLLRSS